MQMEQTFTSWLSMAQRTRQKELLGAHLAAMAIWETTGMIRRTRGGRGVGHHGERVVLGCTVHYKPRLSEPQYAYRRCGVKSKVWGSVKRHHGTPRSSFNRATLGLFT